MPSLNFKTQVFINFALELQKQATLNQEGREEEGEKGRNKKKGGTEEGRERKEEKKED